MCIVTQCFLHLEVSVDDGCLALVQAGHCLTGITEDVEDLRLTEAHIQSLVHLLHHLTRCTRKVEGQLKTQHGSKIQARKQTSASLFDVLTHANQTFQHLQYLQ